MMSRMTPLKRMMVGMLKRVDDKHLKCAYFYLLLRIDFIRFHMFVSVFQQIMMSNLSF